MNHTAYHDDKLLMFLFSYKFWLHRVIDSLDHLSTFVNLSLQSSNKVNEFVGSAINYLSVYINPNIDYRNNNALASL
jgi:hypothetical protein